MTAIVVAGTVLLAAAIVTAGKYMPTSDWGAGYTCRNAAHELRYQVARLLLFGVRWLYKDHPKEYSTIMTAQCTRYTMNNREV